MICISCRNDDHGQCDDLPRQRAIMAGEAMAGRLSEGWWCYCAHKYRDGYRITAMARASSREEEG